MIIEYLYNISLSVIILSIGILSSVHIVNKITKILLSNNFNKTFIFFIHLFLICCFFGIVKMFFDFIINDNNIYIITVIFVGPLISLYSNFIFRYVKSIKPLHF